MFVRWFQEPAQPVARRATRGGTTGAGHDAAQASPHLAGRRPDRGAELLRLQRAYGNHHVQGLVEQSKLKVSLSSDRSERDADRVARALPGGAMPPRREASTTGVPGLDAGAERAIRHARGGGQPLAGSVREPMEQHLGADFAGVRLHTDTRADQLSRSVQALAFTAGNDIFFRRGGYAPGSPTGRYLLAHELTHVTQQQSGTDQPAVQRYIASVNHGLRDPKGEPKDDYGTYRSLQVALEAGGGDYYTGPNTPYKGGVLDQLTKDKPPKILEETEDLYLVGHGKENMVGILGPKAVAAAVARITPDNWRGKIFSLNCWSAYRVNDAPSALENLQEHLAGMGRKNIFATGPVGRSIRHRDWLKDADSSLGVRAVVGKLTGDEEKAYNELLTQSHEEAAKENAGKTPEEAFDIALRAKYEKKPLTVREKAKFATKWGRQFQTSLVKRLETDDRLRGAVGKRLFFGRSGLYEGIAKVASELSPGKERILVLDRSESHPPVLLPESVRPPESSRPLEELRPPEAVRPLEMEPVPEKVHQPEPEPEKVHQSETEPLLHSARSPEDAGRPRSWTWQTITGVGLVGLAAVGVGLAGLAVLGVGLTGLAALGVGLAGLGALALGIWLIKRR
jgi:hypothetical protein